LVLQAVAFSLWKAQKVLDDYHAMNPQEQERVKKFASTKVPGLEKFLELKIPRLERDALKAKLVDESAHKRKVDAIVK
jgi:hypothetical protein